MSARVRGLFIRLLLLVGVIALVGFLFVFGRRIGMGEWALIISIFAVVIGIESIRYVVRQFLSGYRREGKYRE